MCLKVVLIVLVLIQNFQGVILSCRNTLILYTGQSTIPGYGTQAVICESLSSAFENQNETWIGLDIYNKFNLPLTSLTQSSLDKLSGEKLLRLSIDNSLNDIQPNTFEKLQPSVINLTDNSLENLQLYSLATTGTKSIHLINNNISTLKPLLFGTSAQLEDIKIWNEKIDVIPKGVFDVLPDLHQLDLSYNEIEVIEEETFPLHLQELHLTHCNITDINFVTNAFNDSMELRTLDLEYNAIIDIKPNSFKKLSTLERLSLNNNQLKKLHNYSFIELDKVTVLHLKNNFISSTESGTFKEQKSIISLRMDHNKLECFNSSDLFSTTSLSTLSLTYNKLTSLNKDSFKYLTNLHFLHLDGNFIESIETATFINQRSLQVLSLSHNDLTQLTSIFPTGLTKLSINFNKLTYLPEDFFAELSSLQEFYAFGNPWQCPCWWGDIYSTMFAHPKLYRPSTKDAKCFEGFLDGSLPSCVGHEDQTVKCIRDNRYTVKYSEMYFDALGEKFHFDKKLC